MPTQSGCVASTNGKSSRKKARALVERGLGPHQANPVQLNQNFSITWLIASLLCSSLYYFLGGLSVSAKRCLLHWTPTCHFVSTMKTASAADRLVSDGAFYVRVQKTKIVLTIVLLTTVAFANGWFGL
jgi:hypothetical protein